MSSSKRFTGGASSFLPSAITGSLTIMGEGFVSGAGTRGAGAGVGSGGGGTYTVGFGGVVLLGGAAVPGPGAVPASALMYAKSPASKLMPSVGTSVTPKMAHPMQQSKSPAYSR